MLLVSFVVELMFELVLLDSLGNYTPPLTALEIIKKSQIMSSIVSNSLLFAFLLINYSIPKSFINSFLVIVTFGLLSSSIN